MALAPVYGILDQEVLARRRIDIITACEALLEGGLQLIQLRWKDDFNHSAYRTAAVLRTICNRAGAGFVVNDRADIAAMLSRTGVHVGQDDLPVAAARRIVGQEALVGVSTHNEAQFREAIAEPVDYIALGPIFATGSKLRPDPVVGTAKLSIFRALFHGPIVAIGGITRSRAPEVWRAGADSVAVISDLYPERSTKSSVRKRAAEWIHLANDQLRCCP